MNLRQIAPAMFFALSACTTATAAGGDRWARFGEKTQAGPLVVRPDHMIEDSRCPMNARCVRAGRVVIDATVWRNGKRSRIRIESNKPSPVGGGTLIIDGIRPEAFMTSDRPGRSAYRIHFRFDRPN